MSHEHCDKCFLVNCSQSSCPIISCPNGCFARMHPCKRDDHEHICPNVIVPCLNVAYGCPSTVRRRQLSQHLRLCPASITVCSFIHTYQYHAAATAHPPSTVDNEDDETQIVQAIARRDNIWYDHVEEYERKERENASQYEPRRTKAHPGESVIRSEKYPYITMPECMLTTSDRIVCSTCRKHLRQLEENEDERLAQMTEEERAIMSNFTLASPNASSVPSLIRMSSIPIDPSALPFISPSAQTTATPLPALPMPIVSDFAFPSSFLYRLHFFSLLDPGTRRAPVFHEHPRFACAAVCRRDEMEQHWHIHNRIDCVLNTTLVERCPKSQYGCPFQCARLEACRSNGDRIRIGFDARNDAVAFQWHVPTANAPSDLSQLINLPSELLMKILLELDSLSLRNVSVVCQRLRALCQDLLPYRGIVMTEYERSPLSHGDVTWIERRKHWLFTNTSSAVPKWQLTDTSKCPSIAQHLITCPYGETKDLQNEERFALPAWTDPRHVLKPSDDS